MNLLKKLKSIAVLVFFLSFLFSASLTSCGQKAADDDHTEHPAEDAGKDEHPKEEKAEHPADTTKTEPNQ